MRTHLHTSAIEPSKDNRSGSKSSHHSQRQSGETEPADVFPSGYNSANRNGFTDMLDVTRAFQA